MKTLSFRRSSKGNADYFVVLQTADEPDPAEWNTYMDELAVAVRSRGTAAIPLFVATDGGSPNAAQRQRLAKIVSGGERSAMAHVFSTGAFVRAIVSAFLWIARERAAAHAPADFERVCRECGVSPEHVLADFTAVERAFQPVQTLRAIVAETRREIAQYSAVLPKK